MAFINSRTNEPSTQMPKLVESDEEVWIECCGDCLVNWMQNTEKFYLQQQKKMVTAALEPFMFGVTSFVPKAWINLLVQGSVLGNIESDSETLRISSLSALSEDEHEMLNLAEQMFERCAQLVNNKNDIKTIINFVHDVEERPKILEGVIDFVYAEKEVGRLQIFTSLWAPIRRMYDKKKSQVKILVIYFFKIMQSQILSYGHDGIDKIDLCKVRYLEKQARHGDSFTSLNSQGGDAFRRGNYEEALEFYTLAAKRNPFKDSCFGNRAQTSIHQKNFWSAYWDCRRALIREPTNPKNCYRMARACIEIGWIDDALEMNLKAMVHYVDEGQRIAITDQRMKLEKIQKRRDNGTQSGEEETLKKPAVYDSQESVNLLSLMGTGCHLYDEGKYKASLETWTRALAMVSDLGLERLQMTRGDVMLMKVFQGLALVKTGMYNNLMMAIDKLSVILTESPRHVAAMYGLTLAYFTLNRFDEAHQEAVKGLKALEENAETNGCIPSWPSPNLVKLLSRDGIRKNFEELADESGHPPKPDAVCRHHHDIHQSRLEIYLTDPDYKGFVRIECSEACSIEFHLLCWKALKATLPNKNSDKSMVDVSCPTPDCQGFIYSIQVYRPDNKRPVEITSSLPLKPAPKLPKSITKTKTENPAKLQKKMEKKIARKQKKLELQIKVENQVVKKAVVEEIDKKKTLAKDKEPKVFKGEGTVYVKQEAEEQMKPKSSKSKKKKEKGPKHNVLSVDVQFKNDGKQLYGADSVDFDDGYSNVQGLLPAPGTGALPLGDGLLTVPSSIPYPPDALANNLFELFEDILKANGPLFFGSPLIQDVMKDFPEEAMKKIISYGGLYNFLYSNKKFDVVAGRIVCLRENSSIAQRMAEAFFRELQQGPKWQQQSQFDSLPQPGNTSYNQPSSTPIQQPPIQRKPEFSWDKRAKEIASKRLSFSDGTATSHNDRDFASAIMAPDEMPSLAASTVGKVKSKSCEPVDTMINVKSRPASSMFEGIPLIMSTTPSTTGLNSMKDPNVTKAKPSLSDNRLDKLKNGMGLLGTSQFDTSYRNLPLPVKSGNMDLDNLALPSQWEKLKDNTTSSNDNTTLNDNASSLIGENRSRESISSGKGLDLDEEQCLATSIGLSPEHDDIDAMSVMDNVDDDDNDDEDICTVHGTGDNAVINSEGIASLMSKGKQEDSYDQVTTMLGQPELLLSNLSSLLEGKVRRDSQTPSPFSEDNNILGLRSESPSLSQASSESNLSQPPPLKLLKGNFSMLSRNKKGKRIPVNTKSLTSMQSQSHSSLDSSEGKDSHNESQMMKQLEKEIESLNSSAWSHNEVPFEFKSNDLTSTGTRLTHRAETSGGIGCGLVNTEMLDTIDPTVLDIFKRPYNANEKLLYRDSSTVELQSDKIVNSVLDIDLPLNMIGEGKGGGRGKGTEETGRRSNEEILSPSGDLITKVNSLKNLWSECKDGNVEQGSVKNRWENRTLEESFSLPASLSSSLSVISSSSTITTVSSSLALDLPPPFPSLHSDSSLTLSNALFDMMNIATSSDTTYKHLPCTVSSPLAVQQSRSTNPAHASNYCLASRLIPSVSSPLSSILPSSSTLSSHPFDSAFGSSESFKSPATMTGANTTVSWTRSDMDNKSDVSGQHSLSSFPSGVLNPQVPAFQPGVNKSHPKQYDHLTGTVIDFVPDTLNNNVYLRNNNADSKQPYGPSGLLSTHSPDAPEFNPSAPYAFKQLVNSDDTNATFKQLVNSSDTHATFKQLVNSDNTNSTFKQLVNSDNTNSTFKQLVNSDNTNSTFKQYDTLSLLNPNSKEFQPTANQPGLRLPIGSSNSAINSTNPMDTSCQIEVTKMTSVMVNTHITGDMLSRLVTSVEQKVKDCKTLKHQLETGRLDMQEMEEMKNSLTRKLSTTKSNLVLEQQKNKLLEDQVQVLRQEMKLLQDQNADLKYQVCNGDKIQQERNRAVEAEKKIVQIVSQLMVQKLEGRKSDAGRHMKQLWLACSGFSSKGVPIPPAINNKIKEWQDFMKTCEQHLDNLNIALNQQIEQLNQGSLLQELPALSSLVTLPDMPKPPSWMDPSRVGEDSHEIDDIEGMMAGVLPSDRDAKDNGRISLATGGVGVFNQDIKGVFSSQLPHSDLNNIPNQQSAMMNARMGDNSNGVKAMSAPPGLQPLSLPSAMRRNRLLRGLGSNFDPMQSELTMSHTNQPPSTEQLSTTEPNLQQLHLQNHQQQLHQKQQIMTNFDKIVGELQLSFPALTRETVKVFVEVVRRDNGGTLDNKTVSQVVSEVKELVMALIGQPQQEDNQSGFSLSKFKMEDLPIISRSAQQDEDYENICPICHEDMNPDSVRVLDCKHVFHEECIRKWFQRQRSCPNCRVYSLLSEEFPSLK